MIGAQMGNRAAPDIKNRFQNLANKQKREIRMAGKIRKRGGKKMGRAPMMLGIAIHDGEEPPVAMAPIPDPGQVGDPGPGSKDGRRDMPKDPPDLSIKNLLAS
jgi:hypothetical protein